MTSPEDIRVSALCVADEAAWRPFLDRSPNATIFHDPRFLAYHPPGRHDFHHLLFRREGEVVAVLPGGVLPGPGGPVFSSPVGASVGGFALGEGCRLDLATSLVDALVSHARKAGWRGIDVVLPPPIYNGRLSSLASFAISRAGFAVSDRHACFVLNLGALRRKGFEACFRRRAQRHVRAALRGGVRVLRGEGASLLDRFEPMRIDTYARHGSAPTHTCDELGTLAARFPSAMTWHVTERDGAATGGTCLLRLNARVTAALYTCTSAAHADDNGVIVAIADAIDRLAESGVEWYDLGPSASHGRTNEGVVAFKEGLGAEYHVRESWSLRL